MLNAKHVQSSDPSFDLLAADSDVRKLVQPVLEAYERLGVPV